MDDPTFPLTNITQPKENLSLPHLVLDLGPLEMQKLSKQSDCCKLALHPSTQSNLPRPQASLLICDPSLPLLGMQTAIVWWREQLLTTQQHMDERNCVRCAAGMIPITQTMSRMIDTALNAMGPWSIAMDTTPLILS